MKRRFAFVVVLVAVLATSTVTAPMAGESCGCGPDFSKRVALDVCRVVRQVFGNSAFRFCVAAVKACEGK